MKILESLKSLVKGDGPEPAEDEVISYPDPRLEAPNAEVSFTETTREERVELLHRLNRALNSREWGSRLGMAAPQIGLNVRVCIVAGTPMFNPVFVAPKHGAEQQVIEACYSLPKNELYEVPRAKYGWVKYYDVDGNFRDEKVHGIRAIVTQHEVSHLEGKCCNKLGVCVKKS